MKARVREMEAEAAKLREMQAVVSPASTRSPAVYI